MSSIIEDCDVSSKAESLVTSLKGTSPNLPILDLSVGNYSFDPSTDTSPLYSDVTNITLEDLTEVSLEGAGVFDKLMKAASLHMTEEYNANRLTGDEYAKVYVSTIETVMTNATQFVLGKDKARWDSVKAQMEARASKINSFIALVELEKVKLDTVRIYHEMENSGATVALTKIKVANANQENCMIKASTDKERFTVNKIMPVTLAQEQHRLKCLLPTQSKIAEEQLQKERAQTLDTRLDGLTPVSGIIGRQKDVIIKDIETKTYNLDNMLPSQLAILKEQEEAERAKTLSTRTDGSPVTGAVGAQRDSLIADKNNKAYTLSNMLPAQLELINEQRESERAKTQDTRTDNSTVAGSIGKQKDLYTQQIDSFQKDAKHKAAKMYLDGWITQKTLDEGLIAPTELQNATVDTVLSSIRTANGLV